MVALCLLTVLAESGGVAAEAWSRRQCQRCYRTHSATSRVFHTRPECWSCC